MPSVQPLTRSPMRTEGYERITGRRAEPVRLVKQAIEMLLSRPRPKPIAPDCDLTIFAIYFAELECARAAPTHGAASVYPPAPSAIG